MEPQEIIKNIDKAVQIVADALIKAQIVGTLAQEGTVKDIIRNIGGTRDEDLKDLEQDIYLDLLRKDAALLKELKDSGELRFFLVRMIKNQIKSKNSPFYKIYKKPLEKIDDDRHLQDFGEIPA